MRTKRKSARKLGFIHGLPRPKLYVDKVEFVHLSLREGIQSFVEKVDRSLMNLDTYPRIGKPFISTFKRFFGFSSHSQVQPIHSGVTMMLCSQVFRAPGYKVPDRGA